MTSIGYESFNGTDVFWAEGDGPNHGRPLGAVKDKANNRWLYPAYPPLGLTVLADLRKAFGAVQLTAGAAGHENELLQVGARVAARELPATELPVTPFEHQLEGLAYLYHNPRWALLWEPGVGKTKVLVDLKLLLPQSRMLVLAPRVVVATWVKEAAFHSKGALRVGAIEGSAARKKSVIRDYKNYDILITTYGTARTMGHPTLSGATQAVLRDSGRPDVREAARVLRVVGNPKEQAALAKRWASGEPLREVIADVGPQEASWLCDIDYDILVADESHNIKQITSQQTKAALALSVKAKRRYIMSGTPALGDPRHLYPQLRFLAPALMPEDWYSFGEKFLVHAAHNKHIVTGFKNLHIINQRVDRIAIRKRKDECLDLPPRKIIDVPVQPSAEQSRLYDELLETMQADLRTYIASKGSEDVVAVQNAAVLLNKLAQVLSGFIYSRPENDPNAPLNVTELAENPKLDALDELLDGILEDPSHKVIVWCVYATELKTIQALLDRRKIGHVRLDGSTSGKSGPLLEKFDKDPACRVLVGQIGTGIGFTANAASYTVYYSLDWSLDKYLQSIDRNYRAGQTKKVTVYRLICEGTVDEYKALALDSKRDISALMTQKVACIGCSNRATCLVNDTKLFGTGCTYRKSVGRVVAKPKPLARRKKETCDEGDAGMDGHAQDPE